jgi:hypothetical protein
MAKRQQERFKPEQVIDALRKCRGIPARAATILECDRQTVLNYCKKYPKVQAAREEAKETLNDWVESQMIKRIEAGSDTMMIWWSKTQMRSRGYSDRQELTGADGGPIQTEQKTKPDLSKLTVDELLQLRSMVAKATDGTANTG